MNHFFKSVIPFSLFFINTVAITQGRPLSIPFDKAAFYAAMASTKVEEINSFLEVLKETTTLGKSAYEGALQMKKAGLISKAKDKLSLFKSGRIKLDAAIKNDEGNVEYHFLRLIIQENAPKIVRYNKDLQNDIELIRISFKKLPAVVQQAIKEYSKKSRLLKLTDV